MNDRDLMLTSILNCRPVDLVADPKALTPEQNAILMKMKARRALGEPVQYILGHCDFMGIELSVDPHVLIPRPETEILVEQAINRAMSMDLRHGSRILDLGTGSGNIAIAMAKHVPQVLVTAVDIDANALRLAQINATANGVDKLIEFIRADMGAFLSNAAENNRHFDMIISNPPYIRTSDLPGLPTDVKFEPKIALDGGNDGLQFYRMITATAHFLLLSGGYLMLEMGDGQGDAISEMIQRNGYYHPVNFTKDYVSTDRVICMQLKSSPEP